MSSSCKRCLLLDAGNSITHQDIMAQLDMLEPSERTTQAEYDRRLALCKDCDNLISGVCTKCGCYVEYRAGIATKDCPSVDNKLW